MPNFIPILSREECLEDAARCIGCGTCLTVCPVFGEDPREDLTARGRNAKLPALFNAAERNGMDDALNRCLLCGRCARTCPRGIRNDRIVASLRAAAAGVHGLPAAKRVAFRSFLADRKHMERALSFAARLQKILPKTAGVFLGSGEGVPAAPLLHLPPLFARLTEGRHFPSISTTFLSERLETLTPAAKPQTRPLRAAFFSGCAMEFVLPDAAVAMVELLSRLGLEVVFPKEQGCCGLAAHANGDAKSALAMALHNATVLEDCKADLIVTGCATCGSAIREMWPNLDASPEDQKRLAALAMGKMASGQIHFVDPGPKPFRTI